MEVATVQPLDASAKISSPEKQKAPVIANEGFAQTLVARGGIEPPTQGFSILCSTD